MVSAQFVMCKQCLQTHIHSTECAVCVRAHCAHCRPSEHRTIHTFLCRPFELEPTMFQCAVVHILQIKMYFCRLAPAKEKKIVFNLLLLFRNGRSLSSNVIWLNTVKLTQITF